MAVLTCSDRFLGICRRLVGGCLSTVAMLKDATRYGTAKIRQRGAIVGWRFSTIFQVNKYSLGPWRVEIRKTRRPVIFLLLLVARMMVNQPSIKVSYHMVCRTHMEMRHASREHLNFKKIYLRDDALIWRQGQSLFSACTYTSSPGNVFRPLSQEQQCISQRHRSIHKNIAGRDSTACTYDLKSSLIQQLRALVYFIISTNPWQETHFEGSAVHTTPVLRCFWKSLEHSPCFTVRITPQIEKQYHNNTGALDDRPGYSIRSYIFWWGDVSTVRRTQSSGFLVSKLSSCHQSQVLESE